MSPSRIRATGKISTILATAGINVARWIGIEQLCAERRAVEREQARRGVEPFLDDRRERAAQQRRLHLIGDAVELVSGNVDGDWVKLGDGHVRLPLNQSATDFAAHGW